MGLLVDMECDRGAIKTAAMSNVVIGQKRGPTPVTLSAEIIIQHYGIRILGFLQMEWVSFLQA